MEFNTSRSRDIIIHTKVADGTGALNFDLHPFPAANMNIYGSARCDRTRIAEVKSTQLPNGNVYTKDDAESGYKVRLTLQPK
jgi:hypothetical protein